MPAFVASFGPLHLLQAAPLKCGLARSRAVGPGRYRIVHGASPARFSTRLTPTASTARDGGDMASANGSGISQTESYLESLKYAKPAAQVAGGSAISGGIGAGSGESGRRGSGGGRDDSSGGDWKEGDGGMNDEGMLQGMLTRCGLSMRDIPSDIVRAYESGIVGASVIINYLHARSNWLSNLLMRAGPGMRNRFLADKLFLLKIAIEEGMGLAGKLGAEYERRRERFWKEGEFVLANLVTAILADFALVYLPAPSVALQRARGESSWLRKLAVDLPSNIFQTDRKFTLIQRTGGFTLKALQLFTVGFICSAVGVALTNGLVFVRERLDKNYKPETAKTNVLAVSALYATFLGLSSGTRYQLVNGIENHIFPRLFASAPAFAEQLSTFLLRYGNTFWGSQQWVIFCRLANVQKFKAE